jgi:hypothetical protein
MWNAIAAGAVDGGRESDLSLDQLTHSPSTAARRSLVKLYALALAGRQSGPIANTDDLRSATLLQLTAPSELAGQATLTLRPNDPAVQDEVWSCVPATRRVRRISPANRSDGFLGSDLAPDDLECFDGKLEDFSWKVLGTQTVLAPMATLRPSQRTPLTSTRAEVPLSRPRAVFESDGAHGAPWQVVEGLTSVPLPMWVVEGVPRDKYYLHGKLVLYVDMILYRIYWRLAYTWQGEYAGHTMCAQHWSRSPDGEMASGTAATLTSVNERLNRATLTRTTSQVVDQGLDRDFFSIAKVIELAH